MCWTEELWSNRVFLKLRNKEVFSGFFFLKFFFFLFSFYFLFFIIWHFFDFLDFCFGFLKIFWNIFNLLRLLLNVTEVTTGHQKWPKMDQKSKISSFFAQRAKQASTEGQSLPQELEVGPRSGPYLLVYLILRTGKALFSCIVDPGCRETRLPILARVLLGHTAVLSTVHCLCIIKNVCPQLHILKPIWANIM